MYRVWKNNIVQAEMKFRRINLMCVLTKKRFNSHCFEFFGTQQVTCREFFWTVKKNLSVILYTVCYQFNIGEIIGIPKKKQMQDREACN